MSRKLRVRNGDYTDFALVLRKSGLKATPRRMLVLGMLKKAKIPLSTQTIAEKVREADQATIYRILKAFKESDIVRQIDFHHGHAHYELTDLKDHHHLICTECGRAEDVEGCGVEEMERRVLQKIKSFAEIREHSLEFYGTCNACKKKLPQL